MKKWVQSVLAVSLSVTMLSSSALPAFADSTMLVPRLGFHPAHQKRIYLDVSTSEGAKQAEDKQKEEQKAREKEEKEARKLEKSKEKTEPTANATPTSTTEPNADTQDAADPGTPSALTPATPAAAENDKHHWYNFFGGDDKKNKETAQAKPAEPKPAEPEQIQAPDPPPKEPQAAIDPADQPAKKVEKVKDRKKDDKADKDKKDGDKEPVVDRQPTPKEAARVEGYRKRSMAVNERMRQMEKQKAEEARLAPVDGDFFLFDIKTGRLLYKDPAQLKAAAEKEGPAPYYVEFKEAPVNGVYDLAVQGSGHRSNEPILISEDVYWNALSMVLKGVGQAHCPQNNNRTYWILERCYQLDAKVANPMYSETEDQSNVIKGGWFVSDASDPSIVKSTIQNAELSQIMLNIYNISPDSYKYLNFEGGYYSQSAYPDVLDEANWALQFLLSAQRPNGGFSKGIKETIDSNGVSTYTLLPESAEATAYAVMALANGVEAFKSRDELSFSIKFMRAAEKGWRYLSQQRNVDPKLMLLASSAMMRVGNQPEYAQAFQQAKAQVGSVTPETALYLGPQAKDVQIQGASETADLNTRTPSQVVPVIASLLQNNAAADESLAEWMTNLFGYERIGLVPDKKLQLSPVWHAPIEWFAFKTGRLASRFGDELQKDGVIGSHAIDTDLIEKVDQKETEAKSRMEKGYDEIKLADIRERLYLSYALALLNQSYYTNQQQAPTDKKKKHS